METCWSLAEDPLPAQSASCNCPACSRDLGLAKGTCSDLADHLLSSQRAHFNCHAWKKELGQAIENLLRPC